jgi:hypothetical protein
MAWYDYRYPRMIEAIRFFQRQFNRSLSEIRSTIEAFGGHEALPPSRTTFKFLLGYEHRRKNLFETGVSSDHGMGEEELEELLRVGRFGPKGRRVFRE